MIAKQPIQTATNLHLAAAKTLSFIDSEIQKTGKNTITKAIIVKNIEELKVNGSYVFDILRMLGYITITPTDIIRTEKPAAWTDPFETQVHNTKQHQQGTTQQSIKSFDADRLVRMIVNNTYMVLRASERKNIRFAANDFLTATRLKQLGFVEETYPSTFSITDAGIHQLRKYNFRDQLTPDGRYFMLCAENVRERDGENRVTISKVYCEDYLAESYIGTHLDHLAKAGLMLKNPIRFTSLGISVAKQIKENYKIADANPKYEPVAIKTRFLEQPVLGEPIALKALIEHAIFDGQHHVIGDNRANVAQAIGRTRQWMNTRIWHLMDEGCIVKPSRNRLYITEQATQYMSDFYKAVRLGLPNERFFSGQFNTVLWCLGQVENSENLVIGYPPAKSIVPQLINMADDGILVKEGYGFRFSKIGYEAAVVAKTALQEQY